MPTALIVAQAFKETLSVTKVSRALAAGVRGAGWQADVLVASDGGDGLLDALSGEITRWTSYDTVDPMGRPVLARAGWLDDHVAIVESRLVIGLDLLPPAQRQPLKASTRGLGVQLEGLVADGAEKIVVGLGGSATVDGGAGMARAFGWVPYSAGGRILPEGGGALMDLDRFERGRPLGAEVVALCDVDNPLLGPEGAAPVFAPQKGATREEVSRLERGLSRLVAVTAPDGGTACAERRGAGAAGGLGFGLAYFAGAELLRGADWILERAGFHSHLEAADAVVVCEGMFDRTSLSGKLAGIAMARARDAGCPVLLLAPRATDVPDGVVVESGGGRWEEGQLRSRARRGVERVARLLAR